MHILLLILKIIGIALLAVLGILLVVILLLLFVPFCYRAEGSFYENKPYAMVRIRYLFPFLNVFVKYQDGNPEGKANIFGFTAYNFFPSDEEEKKRERKKSKKPKKNDFSKKKPTETDVTKVAAKGADSEAGSRKQIQVQAKENTLIETEQAEEKKTLWEKIKVFIRTLKEKILAFVRKLKSIRDKGIEVKEKVSYYYEIWQREATQRAFSTAKKTLYKVWKSIRPKKGIVNFHFGTGDPGSTGQMCGYLGMLYPFIGKYVMIEPDFENKIYECDFYFKGRITLFVFLRAAWTILFDNDIKELRKTLMNS